MSKIDLKQIISIVSINIKAPEKDINIDSKSSDFDAKSRFCPKSKISRPKNFQDKKINKISFSYIFIISDLKSVSFKLNIETCAEFFCRACSHPRLVFHLYSFLLLLMTRLRAVMKLGDRKSWMTLMPSSIKSYALSAAITS